MENIVTQTLDKLSFYVSPKVGRIFLLIFIS